MMRREGPLPKLTKKFSARRFLFFDTETEAREINPYTKELVFRLGHAVYIEYGSTFKVKRVESHDLETPGDFVELLETLAPGPGILYAVAHNLSFDLQVLDLPFRLHAKAWKLDLPTLSYATTLWHVHKGRATVHFMDSANIFPGKLADLGKDIGLPKYAIDPLNSLDEDLYRYCRRDVMILVRLFERYLAWLRKENLGYFAETLSWQAMNAYRTRFYTGEIVIHEDYVVLGYERQAYHGARTECYFIGQAPQQPYHLLDVNSMYGHIMESEVFPVELIEVRVNVSQPQLAKLLSEFYVIADVELNTDEPAYPFYTASKLVFPVGCFGAFLHHRELECALQKGHIASVGKVLLYRACSIFGGYVRFFSELKRMAQENGNALDERLAKLFLNSLSGRMGQKGYQTFMLGNATHTGIKHYLCKVAGTSYVFDQWDYYGRVFSSVRAGEKPYSCPSIAGAITAYGRMYLWELIKKAGRANVYYCDTDSLLVNTSGLANLAASLDNSRLGFLKSVSTATEVQIFGPKDYRVGLQKRRKGVASPDNANSAPEGLSREFQRMGTAMKRDQHGSVQVREVVKQRRAHYDKGRVLESGFVVPWRLPEDSAQRVFANG